ncbi:MAG TPA: DUF6454 family protein [Novosphingobium sp.]
MFRKLVQVAAALFLPPLSTFALAGAPEFFNHSVEQAQPMGFQPLRGELFHVQGLALEPRRIWVTSVDQRRHRGFVHLFDRASGRLLRRIEVTDGVRYHPGGLSLSGRSLWVPVAEMRPDSSAMLLEIDADTLRIKRRIAVADHLGCVAARGDRLVAGNWDSRQLYLFDLRQGARFRRVPNPSATHYQDMKFVGSTLVASGNLGLWDGTVDWIDPVALQVTRSLQAGAIGALKPIGRGGPLTGEGMAIEGRDLFLIAEDGPSRVLQFRLDAAPIDQLALAGPRATTPQP